MSGYGEAKRRRTERSTSRSPVEKRPKGKKEKKEKKQHREVEDQRARKRSQRSRSRPRKEEGAAGGQQVPSGGQEATLGRTASHASALSDRDKRSAWREELARGESKEEEVESNTLDGFIPEENDEEVERKLAESRARREALIAKWVNRGENGAGPLETPDTPMIQESSSDSEGEEDDEQRGEAKEGDAPEDEAAIQKKRDVMKFILQAKAEHDDDMFQENADEDALKAARGTAQNISMTGASADDWDDAEGYYKAKIGEVMAERYLVVEDNCGKGVFSGVIKAKDQTNNEMVAIKIMRCNDMMRKAAEKEVEVLEKLNRSDRQNKRQCIRLLRHFLYRGHLCLVFECMWDNLRVALKKYTKDKGMSLQAVRAYTKQLLIALRHIHRNHIIHADIKPDNILISAGHNIVKVCDLGSAMYYPEEVDPTPYLVSRFYRAPEIVLGAKYGPPLDVFAMGCTIYELFTGKILFPGRSNNDMLRLFMEIKGKMPHKMIKSGTCMSPNGRGEPLWKQHFDDNLDFKFLDTDKVTRKKVTRVITDLSQKRSILDMVLARVGPEKQRSMEPEDQLYVKKAKQFADLIHQMTILDPEKRVTAQDGLQHPFLVEAGPGSKQADSKGGGGKAGGKSGSGHKR
mmetsp:Transcript_109818/g.309651  ORF Transcript_109818/g.309651 Transcript_109818/m.309651 type:complete len:631 (+) Transcript_109818:111-2003(+)